MTDAADLLKRARDTMLERSAQRDTDKERAMAKTIAVFNAQFGTNMTEYQGWMFMVALKLARAEGGAFREDDYLDAAAYVALAGECRGNDELQPPRAFVDLSAETVAEIMERAAKGPNKAFVSGIVPGSGKLTVEVFGNNKDKSWG